MSHEGEAARTAQVGTVLGGRYRLESVLGQGGMALVYGAFDTVTQRRVALKRLRTDAEARVLEKMIGAFEREYLTLTQLAHPRIVAVYDYGVDGGVPFYTMELLDGGDLHGLAPVEWKRVCLWGRDIASALALLHSRRMVYRDLSPRNVRCTSDGQAKLIDFGAMIAMGPTRELVGTLPCVAPEALQQQPLDARTDIYALGATLYYMLVKRHAYPARDVIQLRDLWRSRPRRPSEFAPATPPALERLILDLISLDPAVRPSSAAEVMQRLSAIAGLRTSEQMLVPQAYLATPSLVGLGVQLANVRKLVLRATDQRGVSLLIRGPAGVGRSRFLDACVLEAKLAGMLVLRSNATDAQEGEYGVARALATQLLKTNDVLALATAEPYLALLGHVVPQLIRERPDVTLEPLDEPAHRQRRLQPALRAWLLDFARMRPLMLAIDDMQHIDGASAGLIAWLAQELAGHGLVLALTARIEEADPGQVLGALELLQQASTLITLEPLSLALTESLLGSVFSDAANLPQLAAYIHAVAGGNPRDIMRLAQHLVSEGVVQYQSGSWSLPDRYRAGQLPSSMAEALKARVEKLSAGARTLAVLFACDPRQHFTFEECVQLTTLGSRAETKLVLDELVEAELVITSGERYSLARQGWESAIDRVATPHEREVAHLRLATLYEQRGGDPFRVAQHLIAAREDARGLDMLLEHARSSTVRTDASADAFFDLIASLPPDWLGVYERGLELCESLDRPRAHRDALLARVGGLFAHAVTDRNGYVFLERRIEAMRRDVGLDEYAALPDTLDPATRLRTALGAAGARLLKLPAHERVFDIPGSIGALTKSVIAALGVISITSDYGAWVRLPVLLPLVPVAPALAVVDLLRLGVGARITGRNEEAMRIYNTVLVRVTQPDRAGLGPLHATATQLRVTLSIATLEAALGREECLVRASWIGEQPHYEAQALLVRHIFHVWRGERREAAQCKQQIEVLRSQTNSHHGFEGQHLLSELCAYTLSDDLTRVKRALDAVEPRAQLYEAWVPVLHYGRGEYQRIRGDLVLAQQELERALPLMEASHHQIWANAAGAYLRVLLELGHHARVRELGSAYVAIADARGLGYGRTLVRMPLSLALCKLGQPGEAIAMADGIIDELRAIGASGLTLGAAYETRARIEFELHNTAGFEHYAALCAEQCGTIAKRLLGARYQRLSLVSPEVDTEVDVFTQFTSTLENCDSSNERARCGLEYLGQQSGATAGLLFTYTDRGLVHSASYGEVEVDESLVGWARSYFARELNEDDHTAAFSTPPTAADSAPPTARSSEPSPMAPPALGPERRFVPVLLSHSVEGRHAVTGLALLVARSAVPFVYPSRIATELSRCVAEAGDVVASYA